MQALEKIQEIAGIPMLPLGLRDSSGKKNFPQMIGVFLIKQQIFVNDTMILNSFLDLLFVQIADKTKLFPLSKVFKLKNILR